MDDVNAVAFQRMKDQADAKFASDVAGYRARQQQADRGLLDENVNRPASVIDQATSRINFLTPDAARILERLRSLGDRAFGPEPVTKENENETSVQAGPRGSVEGLSRAIDTLAGILGQIEEAEKRLSTLA